MTTFADRVPAFAGTTRGATERRPPSLLAESRNPGKAWPIAGRTSQGDGAAAILSLSAAVAAVSTTRLSSSALPAITTPYISRAVSIET